MIIFCNFSFIVFFENFFNFFNFLNIFLKIFQELKLLEKRGSFACVDMAH